MRRAFAAVAFAVIAQQAFAQQALAQEAWPSRNVRFVVAFAPAGVADPIARFVGQALQEKWGQSVVIENRGGAGGNLGAGLVARADPDGYTVLVTTSSFSVNLSLYDKPGYALSDFQTAAVGATTPNIIVAAPGLKFTTLPEVIAAAKTGNFSYGSAGIGTTPHLSAEDIFNVRGKADIRHVPFTGAGPAIVALMGGHIQLAVVALPGAIEQVKAGGVKAIALTTAERRADLPGVPTVSETGAGNVVTATSILFMMPAKTPAAIVAKFNADFNEIVASGRLDKPFAAAGAQPMRLDQAQAQKYVVDEIAQWAGVIKAANIKQE